MSLARQAYMTFRTSPKTMAVEVAARLADNNVVISRDENGKCYTFHDGSYLATAGRGRALKCIIVEGARVYFPTVEKRK